MEVYINGGSLATVMYSKGMIRKKNDKMRTELVLFLLPVMFCT